MSKYKKKNTIKRVVTKESGMEEEDRAKSVDNASLYQMISLDKNTANGSQS